MDDFLNYDPNSVGNPNNNIFGLHPPKKMQACHSSCSLGSYCKLWSRNSPCSEAIFKASLQVDLFDPDFPSMEAGFFYATGR